MCLGSSQTNRLWFSAHSPLGALCDNRSLCVVPRSPPCLVSDGAPSGGGLLPRLREARKPVSGALARPWLDVVLTIASLPLPLARYRGISSI